MFGRKKKKALEAQAAAEKLRLLKHLNGLADEADAIADAGEKLFRLEALKELVQGVIEGKQKDIMEGAQQKGDRFFLGASAVQVPALWGVAFATGMTPLILVTMPVAVGTFLLSNRSAKNEKQRLDNANADFMKELKGLNAYVSALADRVLEEQTDAVAKSPKRDEIFERFPDVKSRFGLAAAKKMAANNNKAPKPEGDKPGI